MSDKEELAALRRMAELEARRSGARARAEQQIANDPITKGAQNFNEGSGFLNNLAAGAGKSVADVGLGVRQIVGAATQGEVDEVKKRDAALMGTGGGIVGNIAGNIGMTVAPGLGAVGVGRALGQQGLQAAGKFALSSPATLGGAATQAGMGAAQAGIQPVATGESRMGNAMLGGVGGGIVPAAGMALKGANAAVEPLYEGGRQKILARALREASGDNTPSVIQNLRSAQSLVPGSSPTAAEVANSGGIAAMQRAAAAVDNEAYTTRAAQQNEARVGALQGLSGTGGEREFYGAARSQAADELYSKAYAKGVDIRRHPETGQFLPKAEISGVKGEITKLMQRPAIVDAMNEARRLAANEGVKLSDPAGSVKGLDYLKRALDDKISATQGNEQRILVDLKHRLLTTIDRLSPDYAQARVTFRDMSKPINQMDIAQEISDKSINKLTGNIQPQAYARALSDDTAAKATGFNKATLANTLEPDQLRTLTNIKDDLARSVMARDLGRGPGSDTVQKLAMTNLMQQSGIPVGVLNAPGLGRIGNFAYRDADEKMKSALAKALLDPKATAALMGKGVPNETAKKIAAGLRMTLGPAATGSTTALLDARQ